MSEFSELAHEIIHGKPLPKSEITMHTKQQVDEAMERLKHDVTAKDVGLGVYADIQTLLSSHEERGRVLEWLERAFRPVQLLGETKFYRFYYQTMIDGPTLTAAVLAAIEKEK